MSNLDYYTPVSDVGVISRLDEVPQGYILIARSVTGIDAQLWSGKRSDKAKRYLCVKPVQGDKVVIEDILVMKENKATPRGYTYRESTLNDGIMALRKQKICVKYVAIDNAQTALCSVILVNRAKSEYAPPKYEYTESDINGFHICFDKVDMARYAQQSQPPQPISQPQPQPISQPMPQPVSQQQPIHRVGSMTNHSIAIELPVQSLSINSPQTQLPLPDSFQRTYSTSSNLSISVNAKTNSTSDGIDGIPFQINPLFNCRTVEDISDSIYQSPYLIDEKYRHEFTLENEVIANRT